MPSKKAEQLRQFSDEDLKARIDILKRELYQRRVKEVTDRIDKPHEFKKMKREIAQIKTILNERRKK